MLGTGAIIETKINVTLPDIPTGIELEQLEPQLPNIPTDLVAIYDIEIPTGIFLKQLNPKRPEIPTDIILTQIKNTL